MQFLVVDPHILVLGTVAVILLAVLVHVAHLGGLVVTFGTLKKNLGVNSKKPGHLGMAQRTLNPKYSGHPIIRISYVHSLMCCKDLRETINPYYKPKISEES